MQVVAKLLRNEFIVRDSRSYKDHFEQRIEVLSKLGEIKVNPETMEVTLSSKTKVSLEEQPINAPKIFSYVDYFTQMGSYLIDTYSIALLAVIAICDGNHILRKMNLIDNLHEKIIELHEDSYVQSLNSCLKESINNALSRFVSLGLLDSKSYQGSHGAVTTWL